MNSYRCPVVYKKKVLMPTTWRKAKRLVTEGKAVFVKDKLGGVYLKLKYDPLKYYTQTVILGIDPGTMYDGYTVLTKKGCINYQYNHQLPINGSLKTIMNKRIMYRRMRRTRLRHRPIRNLSRIGKKITNTSNYYFQNRRGMIERLSKLYPITHISIEDVRFNHRKSKKGKSFSNIEVGKKRFYGYIRKSGYNLSLCSGKATSLIRNSVFGYNGLKKTPNKAHKGFTSHCIDSFSIALRTLKKIYGDDIVVKYTVSFYKDLLRKEVFDIERITYKYRRELHREKNKIRESREYYRYKKGGEKVIIPHYSKKKKIRIKVNDNPSNHGPWTYVYTESQRTFKKFITNYGGTVDRKTEKSKYWEVIDSNYRYYNVKQYEL